MKTLEINELAMQRHDALGKQSDVIDREAYDVAHRQLWADPDYALQLRLWELEVQTTRTSDDNLELLYLRIHYRDELKPAVKSQQQIIDELMARIEALEGR